MDFSSSHRRDNVPIVYLIVFNAEYKYGATSSYDTIFSASVYFIFTAAM
jgi:hypothetical protein